MKFNFTQTLIHKFVFLIICVAFYVSLYNNQAVAESANISSNEINKLQQHIIAVQKLMEQFKYQEAINKILFNKYTKHPQLQYLLANSYIYIGKPVQAVTILGKLFGKNPNNLKIANSYARALIDQNQFDKALNILENTIRQNRELYVIKKNIEKLYLYKSKLLYKDLEHVQTQLEKPYLALMELSNSDIGFNTYIQQNKKLAKSVSKNKLATKKQTQQKNKAGKSNNKPARVEITTKVKKNDKITKIVDRNRNNKDKANIGGDNKKKDNKYPKEAINNRIKSSKPKMPVKSVPKLEQNVKIVFNSWLKAWEIGDYEKYASYYSEKFQYPTLYDTFFHWLEYRQSVLKSQTNINIKIKDLSSKKISNNEVKLVFQQFYKSKNFSNTSIKTMVWQKFKDEWLIVKEYVVKQKNS